MGILIICAILAILLPYFAKIPVAVAMNKEGGYDNKLPREQQKKLTGLGARALAAHQNCFESLAVFAVALAVAFGTQTYTSLVEWLAIGILSLEHYIVCCIGRILTCCAPSYGR